MELFDVITKNPDSMNLYHVILRLRECFMITGFWSVDRVEEFVQELSNAGISILKCNYDCPTNSLTIKVRKSIMKKMPDYRTEALYYYGFVTKALYTFLQKKQVYLLPLLRQCINPDSYEIGDEYRLYNAIMTAPSIYNNLVNVQCIGDGSIQIIF